MSTICRVPNSIKVNAKGIRCRKSIMVRNKVGPKTGMDADKDLAMSNVYRGYIVRTKGSVILQDNILNKGGADVHTNKGVRTGFFRCYGIGTSNFVRIACTLSDRVVDFSRVCMAKGGKDVVNKCTCTVDKVSIGMVKGSARMGARICIKIDTRVQRRLSSLRGSVRRGKRIVGGVAAKLGRFRLITTRGKVSMSGSPHEARLLHTGVGARTSVTRDRGTMSHLRRLIGHKRGTGVDIMHGICSKYIMAVSRRALAMGRLRRSIYFRGGGRKIIVVSLGWASTIPMVFPEGGTGGFAYVSGTLCCGWSA